MLLGKEPAVVAGAIVAFLNSTMSLLVTFGFALDDRKQGAIIGWANTVLALVFMFVVRAHVVARDNLSSNDRAKYFKKN